MYRNTSVNKSGFRAGAYLAAGCIAFLLSGCSGSPSTSAATACVVEATGHEKIGREKVNMAMGIEYGRTVIDNVNVINIIPQDNNRWLVQVTLRIGAKQVGLSNEDAKMTASLFGWEEKNGFILQDVNANFLMMKGSKGFTCQEM